MELVSTGGSGWTFNASSVAAWREGIATDNRDCREKLPRNHGPSIDREGTTRIPGSLDDC